MSNNEQLSIGEKQFIKVKNAVERLMVFSVSGFIAAFVMTGGCSVAIIMDYVRNQMINAPFLGFFVVSALIFIIMYIIIVLYLFNRLKKTVTDFDCPNCRNLIKIERIGWFRLKVSADIEALKNCKKCNENK